MDDLHDEIIAAVQAVMCACLLGCIGGLVLCLLGVWRLP
jgi:hypothetical protein